MLVIPYDELEDDDYDPDDYPLGMSIYWKNGSIRKSNPRR